MYLEKRFHSAVNFSSKKVYFVNTFSSTYTLSTYPAGPLLKIASFCYWLSKVSTVLSGTCI